MTDQFVPIADTEFGKKMEKLRDIIRDVAIPELIKKIEMLGNSVKNIAELQKQYQKQVEEDRKKSSDQIVKE